MVQSPMGDDDSMMLMPGKTRSWQSGKAATGAGGTPSGKPLQRALAAKTPEARREVSRLIQKADLDQRQKASDEVDTAKANELALRELLKSVREAKYDVPSSPQGSIDGKNMLWYEYD